MKKIILITVLMMGTLVSFAQTTKSTVETLPAKVALNESAAPAKTCNKAAAGTKSCCADKAKAEAKGCCADKAKADAKTCQKAGATASVNGVEAKTCSGAAATKPCCKDKAKSATCSKEETAKTCTKAHAAEKAEEPQK